MPLEELEDAFTEEDRAGIARVMELEDAGDLSAALSALRRQKRVLGAGQERHLAEMVRLGDAAPSWAWGRWALGAAYRWALRSEDPRCGQAVLAVFEATYLDEPTYSRSLGTTMAAGDALVEDIALFDLGIFDDYLDLRAGELVLERARCARTWGVSGPSVFQLGGLRGDRLLVVDRVGDRELEVVHTGEAMGTAKDEWMFGRVVSAGTDGLVFASRPVTVGPEAGLLLRRTLRTGGSWLARLGDLHSAISSGGLDVRPGWLATAASLTFGSSLRDDLAWQHTADQAPAPRTSELMAEGLPRQTADHLCVLELALDIAAQDIPGSVEMVAQHAGIALMWPEVRQQAARRYAGSEHQAAWRRLAACMPTHARGHFDELASCA